MRWIEFLGCLSSEFLARLPFCEWEVRRSIARGVPEKQILYEFAGRGLELVCGGDERIRTIFLERGLEEGLVELPFTWSRGEVLARFGEPEKSGAVYESPFLGPCGAWDRFGQPEGTVHVQYQLEADEIERVTLMRADVVP